MTKISQFPDDSEITVDDKLVGTDEDGVSKETYGYQSVPSQNPETFTAYEDVTYELITGWLESMIDVEELKIRISSQIELIKNPITITLPLYKKEVVVEEVVKPVVE